MPLSRAPHESEPTRRRPSIRDIGRRATWFAGLMVGSAYAMSSQAADFMNEASQAYIDYKYGDDTKKD